MTPSDFSDLVKIFGIPGALLASAVIAFYFDAVVPGPSHRREIKQQTEDHLREIAELKAQYDARLAERDRIISDKDRIIAEKTQDSNSWRDLYRRVLSTLERNTNVTQDVVAVARKAVGVDPESPGV